MRGYHTPETNVTILKLNSFTCVPAAEPSNQGTSPDLQNHHPNYHETLPTTEILTDMPQEVYIVYRLGPGSSLARISHYYQEAIKVVPQ